VQGQLASLENIVSAYFIGDVAALNLAQSWKSLIFAIVQGRMGLTLWCYTFQNIQYMASHGVKNSIILDLFRET
jgi:hypothetical protein